MPHTSASRSDDPKGWLVCRTSREIPISAPEVGAGPIRDGGGAKDSGKLPGLASGVLAVVRRVGLPRSKGDLGLRRRLTSIWVALVLVFGLVGCSSFGLGASGTERIKQTGRLRVGMSGDYPPMNVRTTAGTLIGLDADLASALAAILRAELVLVEMPFGELLEAVRTGEVDIAISGITMSPERNLDVPFAGPYYLARKAILGTPERLEGITAVHQLHGRLYRVAAVSGSTSEALIRSSLPSATHLFIGDQNAAVALVLGGEADVMIADDPVIRFALLKNPDSGLTFVESDFSAQPIGIAVRPDDPLLLNLVENYLRSLEHSGLLDELREKWFEHPDWLDRLE
jgi:polar amino acid transport system substrate-binding protein